MDYTVGIDGKTFGERLEDLIKAKGKTLKGVSEETGYAASSLSAYTSGKKNGMPRGETLRKLAEYFDVTCDYLVGSVKASKSQNYDASVEFGFNDKTLTELQKLQPIISYYHDCCKVALPSINPFHNAGDVFNSLFEKDFSSILLDVCYLVAENIINEEDNWEDWGRHSFILQNTHEFRAPGTALVSNKQFVDFSIMQLEREFGEIIRAVLDETLQKNKPTKEDRR